MNIFKTVSDAIKADLKGQVNAVKVAVNKAISGDFIGAFTSGVTERYKTVISEAKKNAAAAKKIVDIKVKNENINNIKNQINLKSTVSNIQSKIVENLNEKNITKDNSVYFKEAASNVVATSATTTEKKKNFIIYFLAGIFLLFFLIKKKK